MIVYNQYELLYSFFIYSVIIPISLGLFRWRLLTRPERWIVAFLLALLADELLSVLCIALHMRNHFLFYVQTVTVLFSVAGVYAGLIRPKQLVWQVASGVSLFMIAEVIFWVGFNHINTVTLTLSRLSPALYAAISLNRLLSASVQPSPVVTPMLYCHVGFLIFGAFSAVSSSVMSYFIETSVDMYFFFTNMSAMMSVVAFVFFSISFLRVKSVPVFQTRQ